LNFKFLSAFIVPVTLSRDKQSRAFSISTKYGVSSRFRQNTEFLPTKYGVGQKLKNTEEILVKNSKYGGKLGHSFLATAAERRKGSV